MISTPKDVLSVINCAIEKRKNISRDDLIQIWQVVSRLDFDNENSRHIISELARGGLDLEEMTDEENYYFENPEGT